LRPPEVPIVHRSSGNLTIYRILSYRAAASKRGYLSNFRPGRFGSRIPAGLNRAVKADEKQAALKKGGGMQAQKWVLILGLLLAGSAWAVGWKAARPDYKWEFPQDHWAREGYKTEWWYFSGHLKSSAGRRFGYQFTIFRVGRVPQPAEIGSRQDAGDFIMGHASISDLDGKRHRFSEVFSQAAPKMGGFGKHPDSLIAWSRGATGKATKWRLSWNGEAFDFEMEDQRQNMGMTLQTRPSKPLVFQGPNGYSQKAEGSAGASQYYSFTRLRTTGRLRLGNERFAVTGESWMDKEFGSNLLSRHHVGWDWFSLQFADGEDVMLYLLRDAQGNVDFAHGTAVSASGSARYLALKDFTVQATATWKSPRTAAVYPAQWSVEVGGRKISVVPELADQENQSATVLSLFYWEGAVRLLDEDGKPVGKGYVELVGYGTRRLPAF
jgi:predicted secreted hydrolase